MKPYWFAIKEMGKSWDECFQTQNPFESWSDAVAFAYKLSSEHKAEIRMSETTGFNNQGHYFLSR